LAETQKLFEQPKILIHQTADHIMASYDADGWYCLKSGIIVQLPSNTQVRYEYLLGLLNSRLVKYLYNDLVGEQARVFPEVKPVQLFKLPIRPINFSDPAEKAAHDRLVGLVESMLALHKQSPRTPQEKEMLARQIESTDAAIDQLVYSLYGLTEEEIKVVEGG
jgi:adenine-specific DNA-methyltransferase